MGSEGDLPPILAAPLCPGPRLSPSSRGHTGGCGARGAGWQGHDRVTPLPSPGNSLRDSRCPSSRPHSSREPAGETQRGEATSAAATSCWAWTETPLSAELLRASPHHPRLLAPRSVRRTGGASGRSNVSPSTPTCTTGGRTSGSPCTPVPGPGCPAGSTVRGGGFPTLGRPASDGPAPGDSGRADGQTGPEGGVLLKVRGS